MTSATRSSRSSIDPRKQALARAINGKKAEGYQIESQDDTQTIIVRSYSRWFGLVSGETREIVRVDDNADIHYEAVDAAPRGAAH